jgi:hypothetical protein
VGTDAALAAGAELVFHVLPSPQPANGPPKASNGGPGSVDGVASGKAAQGGSTKTTAKTAGNASGTPTSGTSSTETETPHP